MGKNKSDLDTGFERSMGTAMHEATLYPNIHLKGTGIYLKRLTRQKGYKVRDLQRLLHLSCPQPIYRWFKGQVLPSVDHLYTLSRLLCMHMESLLLPERESLPEQMRLRLIAYWRAAGFAFPAGENI